MSSILLSPLIKDHFKNSQVSSYNSNYEQNMNNMERQQINNINNGYLTQFEDLRFDNDIIPVGINQGGVNMTLQRHLDFQRGYSEFQLDNMHYDVVDKKDFVHNNMVKSTSRRSFDVNPEKANRSLQLFTGDFENYTPKTEKVPLFEPMTDLSWTNGMPVMTDILENRFLPSNKNNNGNLPFETNVRVRPGIDNKNAEGGYSVYRVNPRNVDALRSEINQKVSYLNQPLQVIKKGEKRGPDPTLTKFKLPDFRETKFTDLVATRSEIEGPKQTGEYTNIQTQRHLEESYKPGPMFKNSGEGPNIENTKFQESKRENYSYNNTTGIHSIYLNPVFTNLQSYTNYDTQRATENDYIGNMSKVERGTYINDPNYAPQKTMREMTEHTEYINGISGGTQQKSYVFSNDMVLPITQRNTLDELPIMGVSTSGYEKGPVYNNDQAKQTLKQQTSHNIVSNLSGYDQGPVYNNDQAKTTLKQQTSHNIVSNLSGYEQGPIYNNDEAKQTLRPQTSHNIVSNLSGYEQGPIYNNDEAKQTLRPQTSHNIVSNLSGYEQGPIYNNDDAKQTLRQQTSHNIVTNLTGYEQPIPVYYNDDAKNTLRQQTSHNIVSNLTGYEQSKPVYYTDEAKNTNRQTLDNVKYDVNVKSQINDTYITFQTDAKPTIRQLTVIDNRVNTVGTAQGNSLYAKNKDDIAKTTIKELTINNEYIGHGDAYHKSSYIMDNEYNAKPTIKETTITQTPGGRVNKSENGNYLLPDELRMTTKQTTLLENYTGNTYSEVSAPPTHMAENNMNIDERREVISSFNRPANGKGDVYGPYIDKDNVRLVEPILYTYIAPARKSLDYSVTPIPTNECINKVYKNSRPTVETSSYYINNSFINTLKDNPYVNDLYHQKNI